MDNGKNKHTMNIITKKITVTGIVQGIGFRPLVYRVARKCGICGTVKNIGGKAEIVVQSTQANISAFINMLNLHNHKDYEMISIQIEDIRIAKLEGFRIINSENSNEMAIIPPDLSICANCEAELYEDSNRRFQNPFISCMVCGPRYTIMERLPYDREHTTMSDFKMCPSCQTEYRSSYNRRFHAQTISCNECGPYLILNDLKEEAAFEKAVRIIESGGILAVKGIGGYHLACSPFIEETVNNLRKLKRRKKKPFAVIFESLKKIAEYCTVSKEEAILLESKARPIVLLDMRTNKMTEATVKGSLYCGAFLPCTPLQILLTRRCGPLIMTSANLSNRPIIREDAVMLAVASPYLNGVLYNTRRIVRSVDDSVVKVIDTNVSQIIRRSRGYVPYPILLPDIQKERQIFAAGSDLKAAFCLYKNGHAVISQYFGDLEEAPILEEYKDAVSDLGAMLKIVPTLAVCDMHPNYHSAGYAKMLGIPILQVQHHHAHIASVMAEHELKGPVIGVAFDGTGYGLDGNIWGGEFLLCRGAEFSRVAHLNYVPLLGGDQSMHDAKKTATCFLLNAGLEQYVEDERSTIIKAAVAQNIHTVLSSSMGRLFDAVASILGIGDENEYEGECAINLEKMAILAVRNHVPPVKLHFELSEKDDIININSQIILEQLCKLKSTVNKGGLALGFHYAIAEMVLNMCELIREREGIHKVVLGGGVFQNTLLIERVLSILRAKEFQVYYNEKVPPNDGSISLGQVYIGLMR